MDTMPSQPLPPIVRRLLVGLFLLLAIAFVGGAFWTLVESRGLEQPTGLALPWRVSEPRRLDLPCVPWVAADGETFLCEWNGTLWQGRLTTGTEVQLDVTPPLPDARLVQVEWAPDGQSALLLYATPLPIGEETPPDDWPVRALDLTTGRVTPLPNAVAGAHLQRLPQGAAYPSRDALLIWEGGVDLRSIETGYNATVYPHVIDTIEIAPPAEGAPLFLARLVVGDSGAVLRVVTVEGARRQERQVDWRLYRGYRVFAWSPDGTWLAYASRDDRVPSPALWVSSLDGARRYQIWKAGDGGKIDNLLWLPDGKTLFFAFVPNGGRPSQRATFYLADGTRSAGRVEPLWRNGFNPVLARDRRTLVFQREYTDDGTPTDEAWIVTLERK